MHTIANIAPITIDYLPPDLQREMTRSGGDAYRFTTEDPTRPGYLLNTQPGYVLVIGGRAGVAWGSDATWIDLRAGESAEDAARIVLNDAEETERRA